MLPAAREARSKSASQITAVPPALRVPDQVVECCLSRQCHPFRDASVHWCNLTVCLSQCYDQDLLFIKWWCWLGAYFSTHCKWIITKWAVFVLVVLLHYLDFLIKASYSAVLQVIIFSLNYSGMRFLRTSLCFVELLSSNLLPVPTLVYQWEEMR